MIVHSAHCEQVQLLKNDDNSSIEVSWEKECSCWAKWLGAASCASHAYFDEIEKPAVSVAKVAVT